MPGQQLARGRHSQEPRYGDSTVQLLGNACTEEEPHEEGKEKVEKKWTRWNEERIQRYRKRSEEGGGRGER